MNGIDAMIALMALTAGFGLLIGAVNEVKNNSQGVMDSVAAKARALECSTIIDSIISNGAIFFDGELNCEANGSTITAIQSSKAKTAQIIGNALKKGELEVEIIKHYLE